MIQNKHRLICKSTNQRTNESASHVSRFTFHALFLLFFLFHLPTATAQKLDPAETIASAIHHQSLGLAYLEESQPSKAIEEFQALVELVPNEAIGYGNLAVAYLRLKKGEDAERWVKRGLEADAMNSQLHFILAEVYQWQSKLEEAIMEMAEAVKLAPDDLEVRYKLARHYLGQRNNPEATDQAIIHLRILREKSPANVVVLLKLAQVLLQREQIEEAKQIGAELNALLWDADEQFLKFLKQGLLLMDKGDAKGAARQIRIFNNVQMNTPRYQQGVGELVTSILGHPIETFTLGFRTRIKAKQSPPIDVRFVDVTQEIGIGSWGGKHIKVFLTDYDNDGDLDVYLLSSRRDVQPNSNLLRNENGKFRSGTVLTAYGIDAAFADLDKDGNQDLYVLAGERDTFLRNDGNGGFTELTDRAVVLFIDYDHDGDLDRFSGNRKGVEMHRNNGDGTFSDVTDQTFLPPDTTGANDAVLGDFDDDGDIDLFVVNREKGCTLYTNLRQGRMQAITDETGVPQDLNFTAVAAGDYDNDGDLDLFLAPGGFYRNRGDGTFALDSRTQMPLPPIQAFDAHFIDYDNDGFLDLWIIGNHPEENGRGVLLFRNDGTGRFVDSSNTLPDTIRNGLHGAVGDYDNDGDLDLLLINNHRKIIALRNDGGNQHGWLQVRLEGVTAGNNKVNIDGIASKVEIKVGDLYQMKYVTEPISHFGLGDAKQADVLRVVWTNGVPQNVILPKANQRLHEKQILKGSCPFLYVHDGEKYQFVTDLLWRSPLGLITPMGFVAPAETKDYVKIPTNLIKPKAGVYSIQITEELWETAYFDEVKLIAVDHPQGTQVFVDERYTPPPFPEFKVYTAKEIHHLKAAFDHHGNDVSDALKEFDYRYAIEHEPGEYQGVVEPHAIVLELGNVSNNQPLTLFLQGWIFPTDTSINVSLSQNPSINPIFPYLQVRDKSGEWQTVIEVIGIPAGKNKTIAVDLTGKFLSTDRHVKIATDMQVYWDSAFFTVGAQDVPTEIAELSARHANVHYRGFSKMYRPTPHAPHLFDYEEVTSERQWRDMGGHYTRYGDVTPLLQHTDDMYVIMNAGDEMTVEFDTAQLPPLKPGWVRDFILFSDGWDKDADINTLFSQTVEPLPFHGLTNYPYSEAESYPNDAEHLRYRLEYNTRRVNHDLPILK